MAYAIGRNYAMIPVGALISVELPGREGEEVLARVLKCSAKGQSCTLQLLESGEQAGVRVSVNISKCRYEIVDEAALVAAADSDSDSEGGAEAMDVFADLGVDAAALEALAAADPASLAARSAEMAAAARAAAAALIDYAGRAAAPSAAAAAAGPPPALHVEGFDPEQIWLQLDALAAPALKRARKQLRKAEDIDSLVAPDVEEALDELLGGGGGGGSEEGEEEEGDSEGSEEEEEEEEEDGSLDYDAMLEAGAGRGGGGGGSSDEEEEEEEADEDAEEEEEEEEEEPAGRGGRRRRLGDAEARAAVEDDFMNLDEMEAFLVQAEAAAAGGSDGEAGESDSDVDDAALGRAGGSSEDEGGDSEAELEAALDAAAGLVGRKRKKGKKKRKFSGYSDSEEEGGSEDDDGGAAAQDLADDPLANATYDDFFGPRKGGPKAAANGRGAAAAKPPARRGRDVLAEDPSTSEDDLGDASDGQGGSSGEEGEESDGGGSGSDGGAGARPSAHQRRLDRVSARIAKLEEAAMGDKSWWMAGEVVGGSRPKNSALEVDLDFETTVKPPPPPTEEATRTLEQLITARIAEGRFDDPVRAAPPPPEKTRVAVELDDKKSGVGLGELYERDYVAAVTGAAEDADAAVREAALAQFKALAAALDALSHGRFRPVPSIEEVTVKVDVPAIMMEEAAPAFASAASMRAPEEVYRAGTGAISGGAPAAGEGEEGGGLAVVALPGGAFKAEAELTKEERRRRRTGKKRAGKKRKAAAEEDAAARAAAKGQAFVPGRKSEEEAKELRKAAGAARATAAGGVSNFSRSTKVFAAMQAAREGGGALPGAGDTDRPAVRASGLKL